LDCRFAIMLGFNSKITFEDANPSLGSDSEKKSQHVDEMAPVPLDYSPLPFLSTRTFCMGVLVSMGGFIFG
jgi:hypothetical protein